ncbi:cytochrome ubiquinol oxidase subunit I [Pseudobacteriovorax antillogorgiicola]|uniref:Cytochrome bd-I ubiquinol oxidase subunit 1 apoprotein n=1 Tax=Pseudobacteriovorax antillogorgiicola TaxID=1513793 RepID=A0A1Y6BVP5_9BACT|nr:cytochrome ubiquinol oxidase subunit I [Pseudobacteriovorax antillogorgiicola]TCS53767.1 cytochrome bd-I ubiquinol oxidase subunit 1 apoprotein [Pseudobacteriovorax antillogorgiicola]SMF22490.1 cytochrome bd-I ubiquinol oxidase subunit 1 apoprotein [Pseudobacteriovorax antillogorgiicola]
MTDLLAARSQMAVSLAFHIIFSTIGMAMPFLMATAHWKWLKTGEQVYRDLTKAWSRGVAIFFATGAVSGTALSFELGLLWPGFMEHAGAIIGMPFSLEGTAFFVEAIALGLFLYGWDRMPRWSHWGAGVVVGISGLLSGMFVISANAWMNSPTGFDWVNGQAINIDPWAAMFNDRAWNMGIHMLIAAFSATGFAVAGLHGILLLKRPNHLFHRRAIKIALLWGCAGAIIQPLSGDLLAKETAEFQPLKLAAMEAHFKTESGASLVIGGIPDIETQEVNFAIKIPYLLSILAFGDPNATVKGLEDFPREEWPPVLLTHISFQVMVGIGSFMMVLALVIVFVRWKKPHLLFHRRLLQILGLTTPLGFIAIEAGWFVTELGRQPWIIYGIMKTKDAVTPMPGMWVPFALFFVVYILLAIILVWLMARQIEAIHKSYP